MRKDSNMPANRKHQPVEAKRAKLVTVARDLFLLDGYDATPMNRIAAGADVTPNTIYWYFTDKEQLLLAVLDDFLETAVAAHALIAKAPLAEQFQQLALYLRRSRNLVSMVHALIDRSEAISRWHNNFHATFEGIYAEAMPRTFTPGDRAAEMKILSFAIEGMVSHDLSKKEIISICQGLASRWSAAPKVASKTRPSVPKKK
ncbi:TetR/AcrR family transcriptional regulator [Stenotrophobium rhamnosiphilum]|uniref:TetR family transcriptional regulator n=1 Tax=Stenotrophobium rhamnosiphilum TaxID=2029166 RepID=A0A2T5MJV8_9GAMM|nr:TetR/AcrR family transcriptional regulator [Stenotrophobium rhamnosiphilum]PTU32848.1 TetR family transcriptional regulator [Stenotrophobium rhamnosiphilum]